MRPRSRSTGKDCNKFVKPRWYLGIYEEGEPPFRSARLRRSGLRSPARFTARLSACLLAFLAALPADVRALGSGAGSTAASFLELGFGARPVALADAFSAVADDAAAAHYNPAGLAYPGARGDGRNELLLSQALLVQDVRMTQVAYARRPFAVHLTRLTLGGIERRTTETAAPDGTFGASDMALGVSGSWRVAGVGLGATAKFISETIGTNSASAYAVDLGALKRFENTPVSLGASMANVGTKIKFIDQANPLPAVLRLGAAYGMTKSFPHALALQLDVPAQSGPVLRLGVEYAGFGPMALRFGYRTRSSAERAASVGSALGSTASSLTHFYGMTMGTGLRTAYGEFDYALAPYGELGTAHRFAYSHRFGGAK